MTHRFRVREIAAQAGLSEATVDRVLHDRPGVRASTAEEVRRAITDLERQHEQLSIARRTLMLDLAVQAPPRFSGAVRAALEAELPGLRPVAVRCRFHLHDGGSPEPLVAALRKAARTGSHGVVLKAPDLPEVRDAVAGLAAAGVPVVTLVTDLPDSRRVAYTGLDNRAAGSTAAYLLAHWLGDRAGDVLVVHGSSPYRGEDERAAGFLGALGELAPRRRTVDVVDDEDRGDALAGAVSAALAAHPRLRGVYSMYAGAGGNTAVLDAFAAQGRRCAAFVAHDLDDENAPLLRAGRLSAVLHHDLRGDLRLACRALLRAHRMLPGPVAVRPSAVQVITPHNVPWNL